MQQVKGKRREGGTFFKGAAWIAVGGFLSKLIGALYRIPLTNFIGGYGMGLYQLVYPLYTLLLTVSATGIPSAISKLTAERVGAGLPLRPFMRTCLRLFAYIGGAGTVLMSALALPLSLAQGAPEALGGYLTLAPSVLLVSVLSVFRGYMQGKNDMFPTAASEILEQVVKVGIGLPFAYLFRGEPVRAVTLLLLAVTVAEGAALLFTWLYAKKKHPCLLLETSQKVKAGHILKTSLPVTASAALLPLSGLIDSVLIVRLLLTHTEEAVGLYGLFTGGAVTLVNLPVSVCYGLAAASVPAVATAKTPEEKRKKMRFALLSTLAVSLPCAVGLFVLAGTAQRLIFPSLGTREGRILVDLVRIFSVSAVTLSCTQTLSACLTASGKPLYATLSMGIAVAVKTLLNCFLVGNPRLSVYGAAIATNIGYTVAFLLDLYYNIKVTKSRKTKDG
ncbi:MAG: polysaccharide biosynthesis protein [Clostridia bacterium]|nr:polysaccharide biosynthesis protein [Clostridia bacterium]